MAYQSVVERIVGVALGMQDARIKIAERSDTYASLNFEGRAEADRELTRPRLLEGSDSGAVSRAAASTQSGTEAGEVVVGGWAAGIK